LTLVACGGAEIEPAAQSQTGLSQPPGEPAPATTPAPEAMRPEAAEQRRGHGPRGKGHGLRSPEKLIERFDTNKNGMLEAAELPERMQEHLGDIDKNGDGIVTKDELSAHFKARFAEHAKKKFERKDLNKDGMLDQAELGEKWSKWSVADQNGDNKLTPEELRAAFEAGKIKGFGRGKHHE
jgi:Ca2+-binding EF-hand superfamily protein